MLATAVLFVLVVANIAKPFDDRERALELIDSAVKALGGPEYLAVKSQVSRGVFTAFEAGRPGLPVDFVDTLALPDKDRTDFGKKKNRTIQANSVDRGWKYDGPRQTIVEQTPEEVEAFKTYARASLDNLLRRDWRRERATLVALGRSEMEPRRWVEGLAVEYDDGLRVEIFFDSQTNLPVLSRYRENLGKGATVETRYHQYIGFGAVQVPRVVDLYRDGIQTARVVFDSVEFNTPVDLKIFDQPTSVKALK